MACGSAARSARLADRRAVTYHRPFYRAEPADQGGVEIGLGREITLREIKDLNSGLASAAGMFDAKLAGDLAVIPVPNGARVLNTTFGGIGNRRFQQMAKEAAEGLRYDWKIVSFGWDGGYLKNKWKDNPDGEAYQSRLTAARSPNLQVTLDRLAGETKSLQSDYAARYPELAAGFASTPRRADEAAFQSVGRDGRRKVDINKATGVTKSSKPVSERTALKAGMQKAQAASKAGYKQGTRDTEAQVPRSHRRPEPQERRGQAGRR